MDDHSRTNPNVVPMPGIVSGDVSALKDLPHKAAAPKTPQPLGITPGMLVAIIASILTFGGTQREKELSTALEALVLERHKHFHVTARKPERDWRQCDNPVCQDFLKIIEQRTPKAEAVIQRFQFDMSLEKMILFQPMPPNHFRVFVQDKPKIQLADEGIATPRSILFP